MFSYIFTPCVKVTDSLQVISFFCFIRQFNLIEKNLLYTHLGCVGEVTNVWLVYYT